MENASYGVIVIGAGPVGENVAVIIGGGVVASEMATAFANLGSVVTVLARDGVLPRAEPFAGERVMNSWQEAGVSVRLGAVCRTLRTSARRHSDAALAYRRPVLR